VYKTEKFMIVKRRKFIFHKTAVYICANAQSNNSPPAGEAEKDCEQHKKREGNRKYSGRDWQTRTSEVEHSRGHQTVTCLAKEVKRKNA
jgi:hypothetical protein